MKKIYFLFSFCFLLLFSVYAKPKNTKTPDWVLNYESVFPDSDYIAQKASGKNADEAKSNAAANMSFYFQTNVNARREVNFKSLETQNGSKTKIKTEQDVVRSTAVDTSTSLTALEFTEPWLNRKDKTWHCVAYAKRSALWTRYEPQVRAAKDKFKSFYDKALETDEPFEKIQLLGIAMREGNDFLEKISYAQFLSEPLTSRNFNDDMILLSSLASVQQTEKSGMPIFVTVANDYGNAVYSAVTKVLSEDGFSVTSGKKDAVYTADAIIDFDVHIDSPTELMVFSPSVRISLSGKSGVVYVYSKNCEKVKAYTDEVGKRKSIRIITDTLLSSFKNDFESVLNGGNK